MNVINRTQFGLLWSRPIWVNGGQHWENQKSDEKPWFQT